MGGISHLKSRAKKLEKDSFLALQGRRHSIVYMDTERNILWGDVLYNERGVLAVPSPMTLEEW